MDPPLLQFSLSDSRYRYLISCLSAVETLPLAYDEEKKIQPEELIKGCLHFATWTATENAQEYFDDPTSPQDSVNSAIVYLQEFLKNWSRWPELEKEGRSAEIIDLICSMIHTTESIEPAGKNDLQRLGELALHIDCQLPTMHHAFIELVNQ